MAEPLTREAFERSLSDAAVVGRRDRLILAAFSVGAGVLQLIFLRWADVHLERASRLGSALPVTVIYIFVVGILRWRMEHSRRSLGPICPQCGIRLMGLSERVAAAICRCDNCGGVVVVGQHAVRH